MQLNQLDIITADPMGAAAFLAKALDLTIEVAEPTFAQVGGCGVTLMFSPTAMVPMEAARGVILHFEVENVAEAEARAVKAGADLLRSCSLTDWGTMSSLVAGPEGIILDLYARPKE